MPHQSYEINTLADYSSAISNFIASNPNCPWSLEPITQDGVFTVMHKTKPWSILFRFVDRESNWGGMQTRIQCTYSGSRSSVFPDTYLGAAHRILPCIGHFVCADDYFIFVPSTPNNGYSVPIGSYYLKGLGDFSDNIYCAVSGYKGRADYPNFPFENATPWAGHRAGSAIWGSTENAWTEMGNGIVNEVFSTNLSSFGSFEGSYSPATIKNLFFDKSATTIFMPMILTRNRGDGKQIPFAECEGIRICNMKFNAAGDIQEYQGNKWFLFNHRESKGYGFAFKGLSTD
ncbi:hypothetical protein ABHP77_000318 [Vibrio cholerae]|uniref:hypothetical protein n=1 Tax=Vibrio cholerae TaxID=666 RepID=UPI001156C957|nr:hypothetical protein [Vibrio cholerae]TQQ34456.1 hypothetical protein FLL66_02250 [Vibrio cholerae]